MNNVNLKTVLTLVISFLWSNNPPEITPIDNQSTNEDINLNIVVIAADADGDNLSYSANSSDDNVSTLIDGNQLTLSPVLDWNGTVEITVTVEDDGNPSLTDTEQFELIVNAVNDAPVLSLIGSQVVDEDNDLVLTLTSTDVDSDNLSYSARISLRKDIQGIEKSMQDTVRLINEVSVNSAPRRRFSR